MNPVRVHVRVLAKIRVAYPERSSSGNLFAAGSRRSRGET